jgi:hypothetical protein
MLQKADSGSKGDLTVSCYALRKYSYTATGYGE